MKSKILKWYYKLFIKGMVWFYLFLFAGVVVFVFLCLTIQIGRQELIRMLWM